MQVGQPLGFGQVDPAVLESAAGELARLGQPQAVDRAQGREHRVDDGAPAMTLKLDDILAGRARRPVEPQDQRLVEQLAERRMAQLAHRGRPRLGQRSPAITRPA